MTTISCWARCGAYGLHLSDEVSDEVRPALCEAELQVCSAAELAELVEVDADENTKLQVANETGHVAERPLESERPSNAKEGVLLRVVGQDFSKRIVEDGADVDWLIYMFFPGRTAEVRVLRRVRRPRRVRTRHPVPPAPVPAR